MMQSYQEEFIAFALSCDVLKFGNFKLKSGRLSPYFFNTGLFDTGAKLGALGRFYARALADSGLKPDVLYGPAYKGIPLASATAIAYAELTGSDIPFVFNRKEAKDHGEGGALVGSGLKGRVVIVDDVITAGTSVRESHGIITGAGAEVAGVLIALDRQEVAMTESQDKNNKGRSAVQEVTECFKIPVFPIITLDNIIDYISDRGGEYLPAVIEYRKSYGI